MMNNRRNKIQDYEVYIDFIFLNNRCCIKSVLDVTHALAMNR